MPCTVARQAPLFMELSRQQYWIGLPFPSPGDLSNPGIEPKFLQLQIDSLLSEKLGKPMFSAVLLTKYIFIENKYEEISNKTYFHSRSMERFRALATYCFPEGTNDFHCFQQYMIEFILLHPDRQCKLILNIFLCQLGFPHDLKTVVYAELSRKRLHGVAPIRSLPLLWDDTNFL